MYGFHAYFITSIPLHKQCLRIVRRALFSELSLLPISLVPLLRNPWDRRDGTCKLRGRECLIFDLLLDQFEIL